MEKCFFKLNKKDLVELDKDVTGFISEMVGKPVQNVVFFYEEEDFDAMEFGIEYEEVLNLTVGAIQGRHDLPVEDYLFDDVVNPLDLEGIYNTVSQKLDGFKSVTLYVTGLTVVTTTVMKYCFENNVELTLMYYNREDNNYYPQIVL